MNWYLRVEKYLTEKGCTFLSTEGGLVFYRDENGKVLGVSEVSITKEIR